MNLRSETKTGGLLLLLAWGAAGCASQETDHHQSTTIYHAPNQPQAVVHLIPTHGNKALGTVTFTAVTGGVRVVAGMTGLAPGLHAFHVRQSGDCSASDTSSDGAHYDPTGKPHGGPGSMNGQIGDLGNFAADAIGEVHLDFVDPHLTLTGPNSIIGHALIVHAGADDYVPQPAGHSDPRVACGVIMSN